MKKLMNLGKVANLVSMFSAHYTTLVLHITIWGHPASTVALLHKWSWLNFLHFITLRNKKIIKLFINWSLIFVFFDYSLKYNSSGNLETITDLDINNYIRNPRNINDKVIFDFTDFYSPLICNRKLYWSNTFCRIYWPKDKLYWLTYQ